MPSLSFRYRMQNAFAWCDPGKHQSSFSVREKKRKRERFVQYISLPLGQGNLIPDFCCFFFFFLLDYGARAAEEQLSGTGGKKNRRIREKSLLQWEDKKDRKNRMLGWVVLDRTGWLNEFIFFVKPYMGWGEKCFNIEVAYIKSSLWCHVWWPLYHWGLCGYQMYCIYSMYCI